MSSWRTALVATVLSAVLAACGESSKPKQSSDDDEDEPRPRKAQSSSSASASSSAKASASGSAAASAAAGEDESAPPEDAPSSAPKDSVTLDNGKHKVAVTIKPDGETRLVAYDKKGKTVAIDDISGTVKPSGGEEAKLKADEEVLVTKLPKLEKGLTTVELALKIAGEKFEETIDVPEGGTAALAKVPKKTIPPGTKGPNGGTVEVVGEHIVELVIDEKTKDMRVYFLNDDLEVIEVPEGTEITLNIEDEGKP
ncbi:MAG: hypothetical protein HOW73_21350 [Polyangiaceae bacterium]|nr:hypothetical protein [Polyangiaceae bacterium]